MLSSAYRVRFVKRLLGLVILLGLFSFPVQGQEPIVYGVFFYSPTCPHCHEVINNHWPGIQDEFGDQLQVLFIDVTTFQGSQIMGQATSAMNISSNGVPMLIIGSDVLVGSLDIPQRAPGIIRAGLEAGGIGYPPIPDIELVFEQVLGDIQQPQQVVTDESNLTEPANMFAIVVLIGLVGSLGIVGTAIWRRSLREDQLLHRIQGRSGWWMMWIGTIIGIVLAGSLLAGSFDDGLTLTLSALVLAIFLILAFNLFENPSLSQVAGWTIPAVILAGLLVAGYLTYVETSLDEATCGVVGDCNTVQQSSYAQILGIPIGVIGIIGYAVMLFIWLTDQRGMLQYADWMLFGMVVLGVGFSSYLTFLEPFVIGASCVWCLTSAVIMTMLLWLSLPVRPLPVTAGKR